MKPLAACLAMAMAVGAVGSMSLHAAPARPSAGHAPHTGHAHLVKRTGDGFRRVQAARLEQGHAQRVAVAPRPSATIPVTSCADDGSAGTLRSVVTSAVDGDTVDLTALACSTITLSTGGIAINVDNLNVVGPGASALTIDAAGGGTAFDLFGAEYGGYGTLAISGLTLTNGYYYGAGGGAIWTATAGNVTLTDSVVSNSSSAGKYASGGGVFAAGTVTLTNSTVSGCTADSSKYDGVGGGVYAAGNVNIVNSTISGNVAKSNGTYTYEGTYYFGSGLGGGVAGGSGVTITNSTISGNSASYGGGVFTNAILTSRNSTISVNSADAANSSGSYGAEGGGVVIATAPTPTGAPSTPLGTGNSLNSTIVFGNNGGGATYGADFGGNVTVAGANNLVGVSTTTMPAGTLTSNPLLGPLANNGGPTLTHALLAGSPAIDTGNNLAALATDQRGAGFPRTNGAGTDIGSFEVQGSIAPPTEYSYLPVPSTSVWAMGLLTALLGWVGWRSGGLVNRRGRRRE